MASLPNYAIKRDLRAYTSFKFHFGRVGPLFWLLDAMRTKSISLILFVALVGSVPTKLQASKVERATKVSIIQLLVEPKKYEGKLVRVRGFVHLEFEGNGVYLHREDYEQGLYSNGLWINVPECTYPDGTTFVSGYADITGRFTAKSHGHMGLWPGEIQDVKGCSSYPK